MLLSGGLAVESGGFERDDRLRKASSTPNERQSLEIYQVPLSFLRLS